MYIYIYMYIRIYIYIYIRLLVVYHLLAHQSLTLPVAQGRYLANRFAIASTSGGTIGVSPAASNSWIPDPWSSSIVGPHQNVGAVITGRRSKRINIYQFVQVKREGCQAPLSCYKLALSCAQWQPTHLRMAPTHCRNVRALRESNLFLCAPAFWWKSI